MMGIVEQRFSMRHTATGAYAPVAVIEPGDVILHIGTFDHLTDPVDPWKGHLIFYKGRVYQVNNWFFINIISNRSEWIR